MYEVDVLEDIEFHESLVQFHERREEALDMPATSLMLASLRSYAAGAIAVQMYGELQNMSNAADLYEEIEKNRARVAYLNGRARKMQKRMHTWKKSTRKRNFYRLRSWIYESEKLQTRTEVAVNALKQLEDSTNPPESSYA